MRFFSLLKDRILFLSLGVGVLIGLAGYTFQYAEGTAYLSNDPKACANCHIMRDQYDGWQKGSHHAVATCNDCHTPHGLIPKYLSKMQNGFWHSKGFTLQDFHEPIQIKPHNAAILQENCLGCHAELVSAITTHSDDPQQAIDCVKCHADVGHGPSQ
jgi:cytochrome c nitrite reductase small subunit